MIPMITVMLSISLNHIQTSVSLSGASRYLPGILTSVSLSGVSRYLPGILTSVRLAVRGKRVLSSMNWFTDSKVRKEYQRRAVAYQYSILG